MPLDPRLRSNKEEPLFVIGLLFSAVCWLVVAITIVGLVYGALAVAFVLVAHALFLAHVRGNGLRVSERQLPELHQRVKAAAGKLGLERIPETYLLQSHGMLNAFATKLLSRRCIVIYSNLADQCEDPRQLDFVIGHELGHFAAGHLSWRFVLLPFRLLPWLGPAYSRACEYTCDRAGLAVAGELEPALRGLCVLAAGGKYAQNANMPAFIEQCGESGTFWMAVYELCSTHPYLCKRALALQEFSAPGSVQRVRRNVLAYPLAPLLGFAVGGVQSAVIVMIVILATMLAIAIPAIKRYQELTALPALLNSAGSLGGLIDNKDEDKDNEDGEDDETEQALKEAEKMVPESGSESDSAKPARRSTPDSP